MNLEEQIAELKRDLEAFKAARLEGLTVREVETLKDTIFERTAATLASGASLSQYVILTLNGKRVAIPSYDKFNPIV